MSLPDRAGLFGEFPTGIVQYTGALGNFVAVSGFDAGAFSLGDVFAFVAACAIGACQSR